MADEVSVLAAGAGRRLGGAFVLCALLWLAVALALGWIG
jgi:hypothetical protein